MPLMISRIGHARGRPVLFAAGRWGSITRHSLSVTSVWYRFVSRICCIRVVWVHMVSPGLVSATPWNHAHPSHSTAFETASKDKEEKVAVFGVKNDNTRLAPLGYYTKQDAYKLMGVDVKYHPHLPSKRGFYILKNNLGLKYLVIDPAIVNVK